MTGHGYGSLIGKVLLRFGKFTGRPPTRGSGRCSTSYSGSEGRLQVASVAPLSLHSISRMGGFSGEYSMKVAAPRHSPPQLRFFFWRRPSLEAIERRLAHVIF